MTTVHMNLKRSTVEGRIASDRLVEWRPVTRVIDTTDNIVVERTKFAGETIDGELTVTVAPGFWQVRTDVAETVLVPDLLTTVEFADLQRVDPVTLEPAAEPPAAWWAALELAGLSLDGGSPSTVFTLDQHIDGGVA